MQPRDEELNEAFTWRSRGSALRIAGAGLASVLAFTVPMDGSGAVSAGGPSVLPLTQPPGLTPAPTGWPDRAPELKTPLEADAWALVYAACQRHGIVEQAVTMYQVLWEESRLTPEVRSPCGRYHGISQFTLSTFRQNVGTMRRLGLIRGNDEWSPFNPAQAIEVMAWMWTQGYHNHWGPYRRVSRRLGATAQAARLN